MALVFSLSGCAGMLPKNNAMHRATDHGDLNETLNCTRSDTMGITRFGNYRLVFMSRDFVNTILVWMDPDSGKTIVLKKNDRKTCIVSNSLPNLVFTPYDKNAKAIERIVDAADRNVDE